MFGYVRAFKPEMKFKEFETYKAVYCSICRYMGKTYGFATRAFLNYDFTFLAVLNMALCEGCVGYEQKKCTCNPLKKCTYLKSEEENLDYTCAVAVALTAYKFRDEYEDGGVFKKICCFFLKNLYNSKEKKAFSKYPELKSIIAEYEVNQKKAESKSDCFIDEAADPSSVALGKIVEKCAVSIGDKEPLYRLGYCMGKWIYLLDCVDDIKKDIKKNNFNPIISEAKETQDPHEFAIKRLQPMLNICESENALALDSLNIKKYITILQNIVYFGLKAARKKVENKEKVK